MFLDACSRIYCDTSFCFTQYSVCCLYSIICYSKRAACKNLRSRDKFCSSSSLTLKYGLIEELQSSVFICSPISLGMPLSSGVCNYFRRCFSYSILFLRQAIWSSHCNSSCFRDCMTAIFLYFWDYCINIALSAVLSGIKHFEFYCRNSSVESTSDVHDM